ncbi:MAG TPA: type II toxin-antitoxin system HicB family antitoxin [Thermomicrobiales bacterium]|nr:type II toxin-antitoxin system HicB family antitoxin [Thermomicrobiales bacterium]
MRRYTIILTPETDDDGSAIYTVEVPALPTCHTWGESIEHALTMARDVVELVTGCLSDTGTLLPDDVTEFPAGVDPHYVYTLHFHDPADRLAATA